MQAHSFRYALLLCAVLPMGLRAPAQQLPTPRQVTAKTAGHSGGIGGMSVPETAAASQDGRSFVMDDGSVWSVPAGGVVGHAGKQLRAFTMSARGGWIAFADGPTVKLWTLASGEVRDIARLDEPVEHLTGSPDETLLVAVTRREDPLLYDVATGKRVRNFPWTPEPDHTHFLDHDSPAAFSGNGALFACGSEVWTVATGESLLRWQGDFQAFGPDDKTLFSLAGNRTVTEWNLVRKEPSSTFDLPIGSSNRFTVQPGGRLGVLRKPLSPTELSVWDMHAGIQTTAISLPPVIEGYRISFLGNSDWILASARQRGTYLVQLSTGNQIASVTSGGDRWALVRTADGAFDADVESLAQQSSRMHGGLVIDGVPFDKSTFSRVPSLLSRLPGAPSATPVTDKPRRSKR